MKINQTERFQLKRGYANTPIQWSSDGKCIAFGVNIRSGNVRQSVIVMDAGNGSSLFELSQRYRFSRSVAFSFDGVHLLPETETVH